MAGRYASACSLTNVARTRSGRRFPPSLNPPANSSAVALVSATRTITSGALPNGKFIGVYSLSPLAGRGLGEGRRAPAVGRPLFIGSTSPLSPALSREYRREGESALNLVAASPCWRARSRRRRA